MSATLGAIYSVVCNCCHVFVFLNEKHLLNLKEILDTFLRNEIRRKTTSIFFLIT